MVYMHKTWFYAALSEDENFVARQVFGVSVNGNTPTNFLYLRNLTRFIFIRKSVRGSGLNFDIFGLRLKLF